MPEINLIKLEGKPFEKLIDVISKGIGTLYKPRAIRKEADSKAYEIGIIEQAKSKALAEGKVLEAETYLRIQERLLFNETERQKSIDNVVEIAAEQLKNEDNISEEPVDKDWSKRFFNLVQDTTDEEMQALWGRILAGETKKPKSYSKRTLEVLKNLSKEEAEIFTKFAELKIKVNEYTVIINNDKGKFIKEEFGITFNDCLLMVELGLISSENSFVISFEPTNNNDKNIYITYGNKGFKIKRKQNSPERNIQVLSFTKIGCELSKLIHPKVNMNYIEKICLSFKHENTDIEYGDILEKNEKKFLINIKEYN
ncbi:TIGR03899 family protein [Polaribacter sp. KT25b]|uniref:DUF2806 domain-containing protein n=1 Tax=Polaribacter sp. KT25b TaxID=1855336 RepID=UPI00087B9B6B|nr:DUF2806 domain-containing protein [Polaribacter sp. KT25b]SDS10146.1 TIGR03899 family protein [Polaribacter sp. KT25b]SDS11413.1 TIGR03899 family protein [Polaribacter sp. KT25b]